MVEGNFSILTFKLKHGFCLLKVGNSIYNFTHKNIKIKTPYAMLLFLF